MDISATREITIQLPDEFHPGRVTLKVLQVQDDEESQGKVKTTAELLAHLHRIRANVTTFRTKEEIDRYIEEERNSWD